MGTTVTPRLRLRRALSPAEWGRLGSMALVILGLNTFGWGIFILTVMPHHFRYQGLGVGLGVAVTAWTLGFRHAFDADHISAIDNVTRKLMADGRRPLGTGFFFALGHSSIVVIVGIGITIAARAVFGALVDPNSTYETLGGMIGTLLAASFLYLIAALNLVVLAGIVRVFRDMRRGLSSEEELERQLQARGLMYRFFGRFMRSINHTWQMYVVGLVFGIGFDTATEVVLLAATAYAATSGLPFYAVLALPLLFSGGMTLFDSLDGCFMNFAYGWAFSRPVRKVYYNLVITGLSIAAAFIIGTVEILGVLPQETHFTGPFWDFVSNFDINKAGFTIAGLFVVVWAVALAVWRFGRIEDRMTPALAGASAGAQGHGRPAAADGAAGADPALMGRAVPGTPQPASPRPQPEVGTAPAVIDTAVRPAEDPAARTREVQETAARRRQAIREACYATVEAACPLPIRRDTVPLPAGLGYLDDEFVVAVSEDDEMAAPRVVLTTRRLLRSDGPARRHHQVVTLADVRSVGIHQLRSGDTEKVVLETVGGSFITIPHPDEIVSPGDLLALVDHARTRAATAPDVHGRLAALSRLHDAGALTRRRRATRNH